MKEIFKKQLNQSKPLTQNLIEINKQKKYFNGEEFKVGDVILYALLKGELIKKAEDKSIFSLKLINLNERHFHLFNFDKKDQTGEVVPIIYLKGGLSI